MGALAVCVAVEATVCDASGADVCGGGATCVGCGCVPCTVIVGRLKTTPTAIPSAPTTATAAITHGRRERDGGLDAPMTSDALVPVDSFDAAMSPGVDALTRGIDTDESATCGKPGRDGCESGSFRCCCT